MRRLVFLMMGLLEIAVAGLLVALGLQVPPTDDVTQSFGRVDAVTHRTEKHLQLMREQVHDLRRPELQRLAKQLEGETRTVTDTLRAQQVDYEMVRTLSDSLGDVSGGLDGLSKSLDADAVGKLGQGLGSVASYLDEKVVPSASQAADHLDESTKALQTDARRLATLLREAPPDLKAAKEIHDGLGRFSEGLDRLGMSLKLQRYDTIREGFQGLKTSLSTGADQVERMARYTYPQVTMNGLKPMVEQKPFWPEGRDIAAGMRKASEGVTAAGKEMESLAADLPKLRGSLDESRKMADKTREALGLALKQQEKMEALLKDVPEHAARLAEALPKLGGDLAKVLRDTRKMREVAAALRESQKALDAALARWPELRTTLSRSATVLRAMQQQLGQVLERREDYEAALRQTIVLADAFAMLLPLFTQQLDRQLGNQEKSLLELEDSLKEVRTTLPAYANTTSRMLDTARLLAWLVGAIVGLHGVYLLAGSGLGRRYAL